MEVPMRDGIATKEQIERAALRLFLRDGIDGASMREVTREAGISLGAVYNHFESKEELAWQLFSSGWSEFALEMRRAAREKKGIRDQLRAMIGYIFQAFDDDPDRVGYVFFSRHQHLHRVNPKLPNPHLVFRVFITNAIARKAFGKIDAEIATTIVMGACIQMIDSKMLKRIKGPLSEHANEVADVCYRMLKA